MEAIGYAFAVIVIAFHVAVALDYYGRRAIMSSAERAREDAEMEDSRYY